MQSDSHSIGEKRLRVNPISKLLAIMFAISPPRFSRRTSSEVLTRASTQIAMRTFDVSAPKARRMKEWKGRNRIVGYSETQGDAEKKRRAAIKRAVRDGSVTTDLEDRAIDAVSGEFSSTYGEITPRGFSDLAKYINLSSDDHFADLGSGLGRTMIQAAAEFHVENAVGVELSCSRHRLAQIHLSKEPKRVVERITLVQGDCADETLWAPTGPLASVTCLYIASLLFSTEMMDRVAQRIIERNSNHPGRRIRIVASLKKFDAESLGDSFREIPYVECETSWSIDLPTNGSKVFLYEAT